MTGTRLIRRQPSVGSETASTVSTRGIYSTDKLRNWVSAYDLNHTDWSETCRRVVEVLCGARMARGGFAWTGFDYRGEPTPYGWPSINSQFGIVDMCGFPKDNFLLLQSLVGIGAGAASVSALELGSTQRRADLRVGALQSRFGGILPQRQEPGSQKVEPLTHLEWKVKYEPGVLEARGTKDGKVVLTDKRETTGEPVAIRLTADRSEINADGEDVAVLTIEVLDKEGRALPTAAD